MGSLIGILSTVILVSTVCTLIFAVGAYIISRKGRDGVGLLEEEQDQGDDVSQPGSIPTARVPTYGSSTLFKRASHDTPQKPVTPTNVNEDFEWK